MTMMICTFIYVFGVILNNSRRNMRPIEIFLNNVFIPPRPKKPTGCHESSFPHTNVCSNSMAFDVVKNLVLTIKRKEIRNLVRWTKMNPYMGCMHTIM